MKRLLNCPENMFLTMNHDSVHFRPANRPNFDLSKIAKILENCDFSPKFDFLYNGRCWLIYVYMAQKWPLGAPKHVFYAI